MDSYEAHVKTHSMLVSIIKFLVARCQLCQSLLNDRTCDSEECLELRKILTDLS